MNPVAEHCHMYRMRRRPSPINERARKAVIKRRACQNLKLWAGSQDIPTAFSQRCFRTLQDGKYCSPHFEQVGRRLRSKQRLPIFGSGSMFLCWLMLTLSVHRRLDNELHTPYRIAQYGRFGTTRLTTPFDIIPCNGAQNPVSPVATGALRWSDLIFSGAGRQATLAVLAAQKRHFGQGWRISMVTGEPDDAGVNDCRINCCLRTESDRHLQHFDLVSHKASSAVYDWSGCESALVRASAAQ